VLKDMNERENNHVPKPEKFHDLFLETSNSSRPQVPWQRAYRDRPSKKKARQ
jgi:hypothetical protein